MLRKVTHVTTNTTYTQNSTLKPGLFSQTLLITLTRFSSSSQDKSKRKRTNKTQDI